MLELVKLWSGIPSKIELALERLERLVHSVADLKLMVRTRPTPPAFVALLIFADELNHEKLYRATEGATTTLSDSRTNDFVAHIVQRPLRNVQVLVICDLERVSVDGIICGVRAATLGASPVGFFESVEVGCQIGARVRLRGA